MSKEAVNLKPTSANINAALCFVLWHHMGASSPIGQPIRKMLRLDQHDHLTAYQLSQAKRINSLLAEQPAQQEPVAFITPLMEQQMFDDWCPYKGNPDPRVVWAAAVDAVNGLLLGVTPQAPKEQS